MNYNEKHDLYGHLLTIKSKLSVLKYLDAEVTEVKDVPNEVKELLFGIKENASEISTILDTCISKLDSSMAKDD